MDNRETRKFTTKGGHEVEVVTYVTGREMREINGVYYEKMKMTAPAAVDGVSDKNAKPLVDLGGKATFAMVEDKRIEVCVVSLDGAVADVIERVLDLHGDDYDEVMDAVNELTVKKNDTATQS